MTRLPFGAVLLAVPLVFTMATDSAMARSAIYKSWDGLYPASQSDDNVIAATGKNCQLCHQYAGGGDGYNAYGWFLRENLSAGASNNDAILSLEDVDHDGNGDTSLAEINAGSQPGWTEGANNTVYSKSADPVDGLQPPGIPNLDPGGTNELPIADINAPSESTVGAPVTFDGSGSYDTDGSITAWDWHFGGSNYASGEVVNYTFDTDGIYNVTLTVTDDAGGSGSLTQAISVVQGNQAPVADAGGPYDGTVGTPISFDGSESSDIDGTINFYDWVFGDGGSATGVSPSYTFGAAGSYSVTLTVEDDGGLTHSASTSVTVTDLSGAPSAPSDLTVNVTTTGKGKNRVTSIVLTWADNSDNEDNFIIESSEQTGKGKSKSWSDWAVLDTVGTDVTSLDLGTVDGTFKYRVKAVNGNGESAYSNEASD